MRRHRPLHLRQSTVVLINEKDLPVDVTRLRLVHVDRGDRCLVRNIVARGAPRCARVERVHGSSARRSQSPRRPRDRGQDLGPVSATMGVPRRAHESIRRATDHCGLTRFGCRRGRRRAKSQRTENRQRADEHEANFSQSRLYVIPNPLSGHRWWTPDTAVGVDLTASRRPDVSSPR